MGKVLAFDSSTSKGNVTIRTHKGDKVTSSSLMELLEFLTIDEERERVVWDVGTFVAPIARLLTTEDLHTFIEKRRFRVGRFTLLYTADRVFQVIKDDKVFHAYSCVGQYYDDLPVPRSLKVVAEMMEEIIRAVTSIGITPKKVSSHANLLQPLFDRLDLPTWMDIPKGVGRYSFPCTKRLWREAHQVGHFDLTWDYDISSAFASRAAELLDTRRGDWIQSDVRPPDAVYGFVEGDVVVESDLAPIVSRDKLGHCIQATGKQWDILPVQLVDMLYQNDLGTFDMYDGWWWIPWQGRPKHKPLYGIIHRLYDMRGKDKTLDRIIKKALSAMFYGRFIQRKANGGPGDWFFPPYAAIIEAEITSQVVEFIVRNKAVENVVSIAVDGVLSDKELKIDEGNGLGKWRFEGVSPALVLGTGVYFHGDKRPSGICYDEAIGMIGKHPDAVEWSKMVKSKVGLGDALDEKGDMGKSVMRPQGFGIKHHHDRKFEEMLGNGEQLLNKVYKSGAYSMKEIKRRKI